MFIFLKVSHRNIVGRIYYLIRPSNTIQVHQVWTWTLVKWRHMTNPISQFGFIRWRLIFWVTRSLSHWSLKIATKSLVPNLIHWCGNTAGNLDSVARFCSSLSLHIFWIPSIMFSTNWTLSVLIQGIKFLRCKWSLYVTKIYFMC